ncbi:FKBP-type peptidyl-prolyl cis-trans isomerase [Pseudomonas cremoricolorata]|uniref:Peptidyl-prolyl cis-trans isomerase n=1 Tax=Pseudomonas cremoricolorata TaxID=157783 RepID=A0A089WR87_9PSED|nr:FKBP-type peptidyl-prolyl cis-trans isomerase [Pseudomonas cremoricolorata]AIR89017.1 peptidylprolyl isomerase [Pseudomonas cremoricolorata]
MRRFLVLCLCLSALPTFAAVPADEPNDVAYSVGASLGERLRKEVPDLPIEALLDGLNAAYQQQPLRLDAQRMQMLLQQHEEQASAAAEQAHTAELMAAEARFLAQERARSGIRDLEKGVLYSELTSGAGAQPMAAGKVEVRYTGRLPDGTVFDQSQTPQWFRLNSVIEGWRLALPQMHVGAKWHLVIPSALAYGAEGAGDLIAPYTPLVFEIELVAVAD